MTLSPGADPPVVVVGLPADGWSGLTQEARDALVGAEVVMGAPRHLDLLPGDMRAARAPLPSPLRPGLADALAVHRGRSLVVLASGDPSWFGIARALVEELGPERVRTIPSPSSMSLACARLGWPVEDVAVVTAVGRPLDALASVLYDGARVLVLSAGPDTPARVVDLLQDRGFGASEVLVLEDLGSVAERVGELDGRPPEQVSALNLVAVTCRADGSRPRLALTPGLDDASYEHDGQLTKRHLRALTLMALAPSPGELLWDIGGGAGSIGIEWMRMHPSCRAIAVESRPDRAERLQRNAARLGVPGVEVVVGRAPKALAGLATPHAIFVGGGLTADGLLETALARLRPGGRLVVNTVVLESEAVVLDAWRRLGGEMARIEVAQPTPIGGFLGWQPARPITQWSVTKPATPTPGWPS